jgi:hypothetical protein
MERFIADSINYTCLTRINAFNLTGKRIIPGMRIKAGGEYKTSVKSYILFFHKSSINTDNN